MEDMNAIKIGDYINFFIASSQLGDIEKIDKLEEAVDWAVEKAYGDAKRTMTGIGKFEDEKKKVLKGMKEKFVEYFSGAVIEEKEAFNEKHKELCECWTNKFRERDANLAKYGKAQKIVNMTFKYMYCWYYKHPSKRGQEEDKKKFQSCHMTLDSYTLNWIYDRTYKEERKKISFTKSVKWSSLDSVEDYLGIEELAKKAIERVFGEMPAIEAEFLIWDYEMIREKINEWVKAMEKYVEESNHYPKERLKDLLNRTLNDANDAKDALDALDALDKFTLPPSSGQK